MALIQSGEPDNAQAAIKIQEYQTQLREMVFELALTEERERRSIAVDLHDHIGQTLALSRIKLANIRSDAIFEGYDRQIADVQRLIEEAIGYTRTLISELSSPALYDLGLEAAVSSLAAQLEDKHELKIKVEAKGPKATLKHGTAVLLLKSVRELLINIIKHAKATQAVVKFSQGEILVWDNGVGFDLTAFDLSASPQKTFGLFSIRERLTHIGGKMKINTSPGQGTSVVLSFTQEGKP